jgi:prokaryotic ubiquitin-like protein Pup
MRQERFHHHTRTEEEAEAAELATGGSDRRAELGDSTEALLDEIDDVLEDNAAEFVRSYVQKGGQ